MPGDASAHISPSCTSTWCAPAKPPAVSAQIFERLTEFERTRDDLRGYIVSSMIYPGAADLVGSGSIFVMLNFVVPRFATIFADGRHEDPTADADHAGGQPHRAGLVVAGGIVLAGGDHRVSGSTSEHRRAGCGGTRSG